MKKQSIVSLLLVLVIVFTMFAGCGKADVSSTDSDTAEEGVTSFAVKGSKNVIEDDDNSDSKDDKTGSKDTKTDSKDIKSGSKDTKSGSKKNVVSKKTSAGNDTYSESKKSGEFLGETKIQKVDHKEYTISAKGSEYATGIKLPKLTKKQATVTYMTNTTYDFIMSENTKANPTAIYHAMKIWKETYGVDVKIEMVDWDNFTSHLVTSVAAGEGPDVMRFVDGRPKWIVNNLVAPLEEKIDLTDSDYDIEYMQDNYSIFGHLYAVSCIGKDMPGGSVLAYNKTKFKNAGIKDPMAMYKSKEWTWSNLIKTAKAMTNASEDEYGLACCAQIQPQNFGLMTLNDNGTVSLHTKDEKFIKSMNILWKIYREDNSGRRTDECRSTFPLGKDAMTFTTTAAYCTMLETAKKNKTTDQFGLVPCPVNDILGAKLPSGRKSEHDYAFAMSSVPKNEEGAIEFLRLVTKVGSNISRKLGKFGQAASYLSKEEKEVFDNVKYAPSSQKDCSDCISGTNAPIYEYLRKPIIFNAKTTDSLSTILANAHSTLKAVIDEYEINAGLHS